MKTAKRIQILITVGALVIAIIHIIWPNLKIDAITLTLIVVAVIPWLAPLFKSLELPGGLKFEFQELEKVGKEAKAAGLIDEKPKKDATEYAFIDFAESNPQLALAGLRMELEKSLKSLAKYKGIELKGHGISFLMHALYKKQVISRQEMAALADMVGTLNRAVHGEELDHRATQWVIDIGPQILSSINKKIRGVKNTK